MSRVRIGPLPRRLLHLATVVTLAAMCVNGSTIVASAAPGGRLWTARYNGPGGGADIANDVALSPDGTKAFVTGESGRDYVTFSYNAATGARRWVMRYDGTGGGADVANDVAVSPDGTKVFVTGESPGSATKRDFATIAYAAGTGAQLWVKRYDGPSSGLDLANAVAVAPDGAMVFVTGRSSDETTGEDFATVAYNAQTGALSWAVRYDGGPYAQAAAVTASPDGTKVFVAGESAGNYTTVAYDVSTGSELWASTYDGPGAFYDVINGLAVSPDGTSVFVTGWSFGTAGNEDYATVAYDASTGGQRWVRRYAGLGGADMARSIAVSPDGATVFVTGRSTRPPADNDYATLAYGASTGNRLWAKRYGGANAYEQGASVTVSPNSNRVYVAGESGSDFVTFAYRAATAETLWTTRYNGPANFYDVPDTIVVSNDGSKVVVTGWSWGGTAAAEDYLTIAYAT